MSLKEEIAKLEEEEEEIEVEERLRGIQESIYGLYRRIGVIVEYIDDQKEVTTITEEQLKQDEQHFRERAWETAWQLKNLELIQKNKDLTKLLKEQENEKENSYEKGFEDGVNYTIKAKERAEEEPKGGTTKEKTSLGLGKRVGDV